ncbi:hypothetical protein BDV40DRAFT_227222 [Aspergillus tamarii]|uniref:Uncharacterized protein n=1 Tax=Aspergillus tamarii TaxID=41984 RepID=A0A5N6UMX3_ASPTM|nr:hypothetical protein BDV40DRAFT_227222 [Aspergillus tamarii]
MSPPTNMVKTKVDLADRGVGACEKDNNERRQLDAAKRTGTGRTPVLVIVVFFIVFLRITIHITKRAHTTKTAPPSLS